MTAKLKLDMIASADISKEDIEKLIKGSIEESTGRKAERVEFKVRNGYHGDGWRRYQKPRFNGARVIFAKEQSVTANEAIGDQNNEVGSRRVFQEARKWAEEQFAFLDEKVCDHKPGKFLGKCFSPNYERYECKHCGKEMQVRINR